MGAGRNSSGPIGVFDSGFGGLSVVRHLRAEMPAEALLYVMDSRHAPYGNKSPEFVCRRALAITQFLCNRGAKAVLVACNTATAIAVATLRERFPLPIVAMEPAVKPAVVASRRGVIGVLATPGTLASRKYAELVKRAAPGVTVLDQPCVPLVERVEQGDLDSEITRRIVAQHVEPLVSQGADVIVLGCTHLTFLAEPIRAAAGAGVSVMDSGTAVARHLRSRLLEQGALNQATGAGRMELWTSGVPETVRPVVRTLLAMESEILLLPELAER